LFGLEQISTGFRLEQFRLNLIQFQIGFAFGLASVYSQESNIITIFLHTIRSCCFGTGFLSKFSDTGREHAFANL
jgi:hypothetical protein